MSVTVHCALCGNNNELGRMFCVACGQRLKFDGPDAISFSSQPKPFRSGRMFLVLLLGLLLLAVVPGLLMVLPPAPLGVVADGRAGQAAEERCRTIRSNISLGGAGADVEVAEAALNGWLSNRISRVHGELLTVKMAAGSLTLEGVCRPQFAGVVGRYFQMPLSLTLRICAQMQSGRLVPVRVSVGRLALPGFAGAPVRQWFAARISPLWRELRLEPILRTAEIHAGRMRLRLDRAP